jgi:hypothetical protein
MKSSTLYIDRLLGPGRQLHYRWVPMGLGGVIIGAVYLAGLNRNLLYLSMLLSASVMISVFLRQWWTLSLGVGACAYLAIVPARVAEFGAFYPAPRNIPGAENMWVTPMGEGETWSYQFTLGKLKKSDEGPNPNGYLYIDGRNLSGLVVSVQGRILNGSAFCSKKNGIDHIAIPLENERAASLTVSLRGMPRAAPKIFHGPEVHGFNVYGDAVWLEFTSKQVRGIYHAKRTSTVTGPL